MLKSTENFVRLRYPPRRLTNSLTKPNPQYQIDLPIATLKPCCKASSFEYNNSIFENIYFLLGASESSVALSVVKEVLIYIYVNDNHPKKIAFY